MEITEIESIYNDDISTIKCYEDERLKDIYEKIDIKMPLNINSVYFSYNDDIINDKLANKFYIYQILKN